MSDLTTTASGIGALADPTRRALYDFVVGAGEPVSREAAAEALGLPSHTVRFHLDRLEVEGLLEVEFRRLTGRSGPGAGRPAKLYRRSTREVSVSLPPRHYDLAGRILAEAVAGARAGTPLEDAITAATREAGRRVVAATPHHEGRRGLVEVLTACGYEPQRRADGIRLTNCPFHALAQEQTDLVCGLNVTFVQAIADEVGDAGEARLDPTPGQCCVTCAGTRAGSDT